MQISRYSITLINEKILHKVKKKNKMKLTLKRH